jgi:diguanylate cyclase (GGDEF)-like protein
MHRDLAFERARLRRRQWILFGALAALALLLGTIITSARTAEAERRQADAWYVHTLQILVLEGKLDAAVQSALHSERGYLLTADGQYRRQLEDHARQVARYTRKIGELTRDNPRQQGNLAALVIAERDYLDRLRSTMALTALGRAADAIDLVHRGEGNRHLSAVTMALNAIQSEEQRLLSARDAKRRQLSKWSKLDAHMLAGVGGLFLAFAAGCAQSAKRAQDRFFALAADLDRFARTDPLTCLPNRRSFEEALSMEIARARRSSTELSLAICDIDFFKRVNDGYGHPVGNDVLRAVAANARRTLRGHDVLARIGGEEFAFIMPGTGSEDAQIACDRVRAAIEREAVALEGGGRLCVTASVGTSSLRENDREHDLVNRADAALYEAKGSGRNVVRLAA